MPTVRILHPGDEELLAQVAAGVFDNAVNPVFVKEFLVDPRHHLAVAIEGDAIVGMASAVHYIHPDKPPQLWINEVAVALSHQNRGIAKSMLTALIELAKELHCTEAWVLADRQNAPAMRLYSSIGGVDTDQVMFTFALDAERAAHPRPPGPSVVDSSIEFYRQLSSARSPSELLQFALKHSEPLIGFDAYVYLTTQNLPEGSARIIAAGMSDEPRVATEYDSLTGLPRLDHLRIIHSELVKRLSLGNGATSVNLSPTDEYSELASALRGYSVAIVLPVFDRGTVFAHFLMLRKSAAHPTERQLNAAVHATNIYTRLIVELRVLEELRKTSERLNHELDGVVNIQRRLLPPIPNDTPTMSFAVRYLPSAEAGGDFYSVRHITPEHFALVIADVCGHGAGAAVVASMLRAWLGAFRLGWQPLENVGAGLNTLWNEVASISTFATAAFYEVNEKTGQLRSINCGHPPALVISPAGEIREVEHESSLPLGVVRNLETKIIHDQLSPGDTLLLYTDGIPEARNPAGNLFGRSRLYEIAKQIATESNLQHAADRIIREVEQFRGAEPQCDDLCVVMARYKGS